MKIEINLKIIIALIFFFMFDNINMYLIFLLFITIHEIAHLIIGLIIGGIPKKMTISIFGVSMEFYCYRKNKMIHKIMFFLIGPLTNIIIGMVCNRVIMPEELKQNIVLTNYAIGIFNLFPILPLDGGKILKEIFKKIFGLDYSNKIMIILSKFFLISISLIYSILIIEIKNIMILFLLIYLWYLYIIEEKKYYLYLKTKRVLGNII